jgi:diacylglycerol kinase (ATP)
MNHIFIVNPCAGKSNGEQIVRDAVAELDGLRNSEIYVTKSSGDATAYVASLCEAMPKTKLRFYACGGDGTLNEVVTGAVGHDNAEVISFPIGSGNDYVKYYGGKKDFFSLGMLVEGRVDDVDVMRVGMRYALNMCNFGFDAVACRAMNEVRRKPIIGGRNAYTTGVVTALFTGRRTSCVVKVDGEKIHEGEMLLCTMGNGRYIGGAYECSPLSKNNDGLIEVCLFKPLTLLEFARMLGSYRDGTYMSRKDVQAKMVYLRGRRVEIEAEKEMDFCVDGEMLRGKDFEVEQLGKAVRFVVPKR